jgi:hypothetical protein
MVARQIPVESCNLKVGRSNRSRVNRHLSLFAKLRRIVCLSCGMWVGSRLERLVACGKACA